MRNNRWLLFWCLKTSAQAALMQYQWDNYETKLEIPTPPLTSKGVWLNVQIENSEEIDRIMRQAPSRSRGKNED